MTTRKGSMPETPLNVSRETHERLELYVARLREWQKRINLVSPHTLDSLWERHIRDSLQLTGLSPLARIWADMGSGGGLPGIVVGCVLADVAGAHVHMIEANHKKAAFLRAISVELALPATVHAERIEDTIPALDNVDVVTARALAPLDALIGYSKLLLKKGSVGLFPKGRDYQSELTAALQNWQVSYHLFESVTDPDARIIEVSWPASPS